MMDTETFEAIKAAVLGLGDSLDAIREALAAAGIKGVPEDSSYCAISAYIDKHWPGFSPMTGENNDVTFACGCNLDEDCMCFDCRSEESHRICLPQPHLRFIHCFNQYEFPELISGVEYDG